MKRLNLSGTIPLAVLFAAGSSSAEPIDFPESLTYEENFDALDPEFPDLLAFLGPEWSFIFTDESVDPPFVDEVEAQDIFGWAQEFLSNSTFLPTETLDESSFTNPLFAAGLNGGTGPDFDAIAPTVAPQLLTDLGFAGGWLINEGLGDAFDVNGDETLFEQRFSASARVEFQNLPEHVGIDIDFLMAAGDSIDSTPTRNDRDGPFEIRVDGETVFSQFGGNFTPPAGVGVLAINANLTGSYQETWNNNPALDENDRAITAWRMDSAYDFSTGLALSSIDHTADTLTVEFIHRIGSFPDDEYTAIDNVAITLLTEAFVPNNQWPGGTTFFEDFNDTLDPNFWELSGWANTEVFASGTTELTGNMDSLAGVRNSPPDPEVPGDMGDFFDADFPIDPLVPSQSLSDLDSGFSGNWIVSNLGPGNTSLSFRALPPHTGVSMGFKFAGGNSIDEPDRFVDDNPDDDLFLDESNFAVLVDGEFRLVTFIDGTGIGFIDPIDNEDGVPFADLPFEAELAVNANLRWLLPRAVVPGSAFGSGPPEPRLGLRFRLRLHCCAAASRNRSYR